MPTKPMTRGELLDLPAAIPLYPDAARALGVGRTRAYEMVKNETWPTRVLRLGNSYRVPTAEVLALLGINPEPAATTGGDAA